MLLYVVGVILGQRVDKKLSGIHYANKTLESVQRNYITAEKDLIIWVSPLLRIYFLFNCR